MERPKRDETEEDLLRMQEEFLKAKASSSAKLVKPEKKKDEGAAKVKPHGKPSGKLIAQRLSNDNEQ